MTLIIFKTLVDTDGLIGGWAVSHVGDGIWLSLQVGELPLRLCDWCTRCQAAPCICVCSRAGYTQALVMLVQISRVKIMGMAG